VSPREVIARALCACSFTQPDRSAIEIDEEWPHWLGEADAVIDALEKMRATEAMERVHDEVGCLSATEAWQAMVGAMRDQ